MGRKKIDTNCKLPEGKINSTFTKRKRGAINKAMQLGKLCDVDVALIAFHPRKDAVIAVSHGGTVDDIVNKFHKFQEQNFKKVELNEELRMQPHQLEPNELQQQQQMHPNTQVEELRAQPHQMHPNTQVEELRTQPLQLQANQMHPNTQVLHLPPPMFELMQRGIGVPVDQLQGFDIRVQGNNGSPNSQRQLLQAQLLAPPDFRHNNYGQ